MFRLLGFLIGSATAITAILLLLGVPDFHWPDGEIDQQRFDAAVEKLREKQQEATEVAEVVVEEVVTAVADIQDNVGTVVDKTLPEAAAMVEEATAAPVPVPVEDPLPVAAAELQWYSFWNPFRSELAASGFVSQLEKVTGLDYRVVKVKTGVYEVAFAYASDNERRSKLTRISSATGLELPDT